ncbi:MAG: portal protein [Hydrotalea sp.]|nr:portal protein [Hydrotalea sp.]
MKKSPTNISQPASPASNGISHSISPGISHGVDLELLNIEKRYQQTASKRLAWFDWWRECYKYALPQYDTQDIFGHGNLATNIRQTSIYDSTAVLAVEQLASNLVQDLLPSQTPWFDLVAVDKGDDSVSNTTNGGAATNNTATNQSVLKKITDDISQMLQAGDFYLEVHQAMLDLVVAGTGVLAVEKNNQGGVNFRAIPTTAILLEDTDDGQDNDNGMATSGAVFKESYLAADKITAIVQQNMAQNPNDDGDVVMVEKYLKDIIASSDDDKVAVVEALIPNAANGLVDYFLFMPSGGRYNKPWLLSRGQFRQMPLMVFRFMKAPGEVYGRSPVMRALPDIITANQVVELILKNASLNVAGIWLADDDGVINLNNLKLEPGAIIQKAVGSPGLTPLRTGTLDLSQVVLSDLRQNIRNALLADNILAGDLFNATSNAKTAAEVRQISQSQTRMFAASYHRLVHELLHPLVHRLLAVMVDEGHAPSWVLDQKQVRVAVSSPITRRQEMQEAGNMLSLLQTATAIGLDVAPYIDRGDLVRKLFSYFQLTPTAPTQPSKPAE